MTRIPKYSRHRSGGRDRACVRINGRRHYLGTWGTTESRRRYHELIAGHLAGNQPPVAAPVAVTVAAVCELFMLHAAEYYRDPDGEPTSEVACYRQAIRPLLAVAAGFPASDFGPSLFREVIADMIDRGWCRKTINKHVSRLRKVFKWAASREVIGADVYQALITVDGLRAGRSDAKETDPVRPVPVEDIEAVRPRVSVQVAAMVDVQLLTGMRPGEVVGMCRADLDMTGDVWVYTPPRHKTAHHGHDRRVLIGPQAQVIMGPLLLRLDATTPLFSATEALDSYYAARHAARRTPLSSGNRPRKRRGSRSRAYSAASYRRAIRRACEAAGVTTWSPNQLRHNAATMLRREYGIDMARTILGHRLGSSVTEVYAEADHDRAVAVMRAVG